MATAVTLCQLMRGECVSAWACVWRGTPPPRIDSVLAALAASACARRLGRSVSDVAGCVAVSGALRFRRRGRRRSKHLCGKRRDQRCRRLLARINKRPGRLHHLPSAFTLRSGVRRPVGVGPHQLAARYPAPRPRRAARLKKRRPSAPTAPAPSIRRDTRGNSGASRSRLDRPRKPPRQTELSVPRAHTLDCSNYSSVPPQSPLTPYRVNPPLAIPPAKALGSAKEGGPRRRAARQ
eukprot:363950-Chlamydomonas_euryale.AAC.13